MPLSDHAIEPALSNLRRFMTLSDAGERHLARLLASPRHLKPRALLVPEGHKLDGFFALLSGWAVEFRQLRDGSRQILNFRLPGEIIAVEALVYGTALYSVRGLTACSIVPVSRDAFEDIQERFPRLASAFLLSRLSDNAILQECAVNLGRRAAFARIAHLLLELDRRAERIVHPPALRALPIRQQDIADATGLTGSYVNRLVQAMRKRNYIRCEEGGIAVCNHAALAAAAHFRPDYLDVRRRTRWQQNAPQTPAFALAETLLIAARRRAP